MIDQLFAAFFIAVYAAWIVLIYVALARKGR